MAAGASSPELFSCLTSIFVTKSALGLGCIIGSELFDQLIIISSALLSARHGHLRLNKEIVLREVFFYALSIALLYYAVSDRRENKDGSIRLHISMLDGELMILAYACYVFVCGYYDRMLRYFAKKEVTQGTLAKGGLLDGEAYEEPEVWETYLLHMI